MNLPHVNTAMQNRTSIKSIQAFEAAARLGSFAVAAEELAVTPSAVSHQIKLLEEQLGVTLFHRVHRAVVLTEAGRHYANEVIAAFARIEAATRNVAVAGISTVLTVHSTPSFASQWLNVGNLVESHLLVVRSRYRNRPLLFYYMSGLNKVAKRYSYCGSLNCMSCISPCRMAAA
jgi:hypothetical protein